MDGRRRPSGRYRIRLTGPLASHLERCRLALVRGVSFLDHLAALDDAVEVDDDRVALHLRVEVALHFGGIVVDALTSLGVIDDVGSSLELPALALLRVAVEERELRVVADVLRRAAVRL